MTNWKINNYNQDIATRILPNGGEESRLISGLPVGTSIDPQDSDIQLQKAQDIKVKEIKELRNSEFGELIFYDTVGSDDLYLKPNPSVNIFLSGYSLPDGGYREWFPYNLDGSKREESILISKDDLISMADHYENRKTNSYNDCNKRIFEVKELTSIEEVEAYDINKTVI